MHAKSSSNISITGHYTFTSAGEDPTAALKYWRRILSAGVIIKLVKQLPLSYIKK